MNSPTFICVGPGRTGTSWLREMLEKHPDVALSTVKETEYYSNNSEKKMSWYLSHFPDTSARAVGEISSMYYVDSSIAERIKADFPDAKIIFAIRDPKELLESFFKFGVRRGVAKPNLADALHEPIGIYMGTGYKHRLRNNTLVPSDKVTLLDSVMLSKWLKHFLICFGKNNVFIFDFSRISSDSTNLLKELYEFLNVDSSFTPSGADEVVNQSASPRNKLIAKLAHRTAFTLRKLGMYKLLSALHKSRLVKLLLFRNSTPSENQLAESLVLSPETEALLVAERTKLKQLTDEHQLKL